MEIIYVEDAMLRNLFLAAVDLFSISLLAAAAGALLAKRRTLMYWWVMMAGFFAFVVTLSLSLLTGNLVLLLGGIGFLAVLPLSYCRQKELFWRRRRKKNDCGKLNGNSKGRRLSKMSSTKLKPTIIHGLCRKLKTAKRDLR